MILRELVAFLAVLAAPVVASAQVDGVDATSITIGQPAAFSGASAGLGIELWRGVEARRRELNDAGGVSGRELKLALCDDKYDPETSARCAIDLITKRHAFLLANTVGTPTIIRIIPLLQAWSKDNVLIFGNFTGAKPQRSMPAAPFVFNMRASYEQETATHVNVCAKAGRKKIGTFIQNDAYGKDGEEGVRLAAKAAGATFAASTSYERGASTDSDMSSHVNVLRAAGVNCVSTTGSYQAIAAFVRAARDAQWKVPIFAVSFTGADQLMSQLDGKTSTARLIMTQVVPHVDDTRFALVREYRAAMDKYKPALPASAAADGYHPTKSYSFGSLEGYLNTKLLGAALAMAGKTLTRASFKTAAESLHNFDIGIGDARVTFGAVTGPDNVHNHQALQTVWLTVADDNRWVAVDDMDALAKQLVKD